MTGESSLPQLSIGLMKCIYRPVGLTSSCSPGSQIAPACTCSPRPPPPPRRAPVSPQCRDRVSRDTPRSDLTPTSSRVENFIYFLGLLQFESYLEEGNQFSEFIPKYWKRGKTTKTILRELATSRTEI